MENKILLVDEVAAMLRVSESTINRWLGESRRGENTFPLPVSQAGGKRRWTRDSIDSFIASLYVKPQRPVRQRRRSAKAFAERQNATDRALDRFKGRRES